ncbi:hypothetical protein EUX98_g6006 [Antrodiella citrinella]|uniref:D-arabinono-1,4-lactone oxidase n=1 Tax=Antrodiella citrinella TaxID=2447956 RepID=A0A4S4MQE0_9APHY|nr:hypothetical protein EUX98_g6006 [Antrodiella citrinella]
MLSTMDVSPPPLSTLPSETLAALLAPITVPSDSPSARFTNWGLSFTCSPQVVYEPRTEDECALVVEHGRRTGQRVRAAGVGHSPSDVACTSGFMLRTTRLDRVLEMDVEKGIVVAQGGTTLNALHAALASHGLAMANVGSISEQTIAGLITTASHGTGIHHKALSTYARALLLLLPDGSRVHCDPATHPDLYWASLCGLGSTGIVLRVHLAVVPAFRLKELQRSLPFDHVVTNIDSIVHSAEHVRLWWFPQAGTVRVSSSDRTTDPKKPAASFLWHNLLGYHLIQFLFLIGRYLPILNAWICRFSAWLDSAPTVAVDDSWRIFNVDCKYPQYTTEWAIPYTATRACLQDIRIWLEAEQANPNGLRPHFPIEIRFSDADDIWLSPSHDQRTTWIGLIQYKPYGLPVPYRALFAHFESIVTQHGGRPHWAKAHPLRPRDLRRLYPSDLDVPHAQPGKTPRRGFTDFVDVLTRVDPEGLLRNPYIDRHLFGIEDDASGERVFKARP